MKRFLSRFKRSSFFRTTTLIAGAVLAVGMLTSFSARAVHEAGIFELDGDAVTQSTNGVGYLPDDWDRVFNKQALGDPTVFVDSTIEDPSVDITYFTGGGSKDVNDISEWQSTENNVAPDKDQILNAFAAHYVNSSNGHRILYFGLDRFDNSGDAQVGFWFLKGNISVAIDGDPNTADPFIGNHVVGDILVLSDFVQGGKVPNVRVYEWVGGKKPLSLKFTGADCKDASAGDAACATVFNAGTADDPNVPWPFVPKDGASGMYDTGEFFEGGIDLTELNILEGCFNTFMAETRSSQSVTAQLKDYALGAFPLCHADVATQVHDASHVDITNSTVKVGNQVHDMATVTGSGIDNPPEPTGYVTFHLYTGLDCQAANLKSSEKVDITGDSTNDGVVTVESSAFTPAAGEYSYSAVYSGDDNYPSASLKTEDCEPFTIAKYDSKVVTEIHKMGDHTTDIQGGSVDVLTKIHDFAQVSEISDDSSAPAPTGNVTFKFYSDLLCTTEVTGDVDGTTYPYMTALDGSAQAETPDLTTSAGPLAFKAYYGGDDNYNASADSSCEKLTANKLKPSIRTEIRDGTDKNLTNTTVKVGVTIHDWATVTGTGPTPTGDVTFKFFSDLTCTTEVTGDVGGTTYPYTTALSSGEAVTPSMTPPASSLAFSASYGGDTIYDPSSAADCEPLTVEKYDSKTVTEIHKMGDHTTDIQGGSVDVLTKIHDFAQVSEISDDSGAPTPTGDVTFKFYSDLLCTTEVKGDVDGTAYPYTKALDGSAQAETPDLTTSAGPLAFKAVYGGDSNYNASVDSSCEKLTANKLDSSITTEIHDPSHTDITGQTVSYGITIHDQGIVSGAGPDPTGMVSFQLFSDLTCTTASGGPVQVALASDSSADGVAYAETTPFQPATGDLSFSASYLGDSNYNPSGPAICEPLTVQGEFQGCTPGYWKVPQHWDSWVATGYSTGDALGSVFDFSGTMPKISVYAGDSMVDALNYQGGNGPDGAARILLRAAVAAVLNAAHPDITYPMAQQDIIDSVSAALQSGSRDDMLALATQLDNANNGVLFDNAGTEQCPLN